MANNAFTVDSRQLKRLNKSLSKAGVKFEKGTTRLLKKIGVVVQGLAFKYSPESPSRAQYAAQNKSGVTRRSASSITSRSLRDSITMKAGKDSVSIFVPSNSRAGKYAEKIHDEKGSSWQKRGVRTRQKGSKSDDKYIYRAYDDSEKEQSALVDQVIKELINGIGV